jgi:hypothetical protein
MADAPAGTPPAAPQPTNPQANAPPAGGNGHGEAPPASNPEPTAAEIWEALKQRGHTVKRGPDGKLSVVRPVKANGETFDFDLTNEESWHGVSTHKAAQRAQTKAQEHIKAWDQIIAAFDADPIGTVRELARVRGKSIHEMEKTIAQEVVRREKMSPEARELEEYKAEKARRDAEEAQQKEAQAARQAQVESKRWLDGIKRASEATGLPFTPAVVRLMAGEAIEERKRNGGGAVDLMKIAARVDDMINEAHEARLSKLPDDKLLSRFKEDTRKRFRAAEAKAAEAAAAPPAPSVPPPVQGEARAAGQAAPVNGKKHRPKTGAEKRAALAKVLADKGIKGGTPIM